MTKRPRVEGTGDGGAMSVEVKAMVGVKEGRYSS